MSAALTAMVEMASELCTEVNRLRDKLADVQAERDEALDALEAIVKEANNHPFNPIGHFVEHGRTNICAILRKHGRLV